MSKKVKVGQNFSKIKVCLKTNFRKKLYDFINSNYSISDRKSSFNPIVLKIFDRFEYKSITLPDHILVIYFQNDQTV